MNTPIVDFVQRYAEGDTLRLHMPGHKGCARLGMEPYDITEIAGADSLYEAGGIIAESESNAAALFGSGATFYSAEGASLAIRAMLYLACTEAKKRNAPPVILAGRNAHKSFLTACGMLDLSICWLYPAEEESYLSCRIDAARLEDALAGMDAPPFALYITSPDYLGQRCDIAALAEVCHRHDMLLLVDNAHGAYLHFLEEPLHPLDLGADLCCDSAHKTLPVLTGGAYLHLSRTLPKSYCENAKGALALFGSTSPSYLILASLDAANRYLAEGYRATLTTYTKKVEELKKSLVPFGFSLVGEEPLKLTIAAKPYGYTGRELAEILRVKRCECEFADEDYLVLMLTPDIDDAALEKLREALASIPKRRPVGAQAPKTVALEKVCSIREALFAARERVCLDEAEGRVLASLNVGCPPAVPIAICGERLNSEAICAMRYYGIVFCDVLI